MLVVLTQLADSVAFVEAADRGVPFVLFAVFLPLVGQGEGIGRAGLSLSVEGLWAMWNI
jgi:hypothetical protein